jgi:hypothetical protein
MLIGARLRARSEPLRPSRPKCPHCSSALVAAEEARLGPSGRIDYDWLCDDCGKPSGLRSNSDGILAFEPRSRGGSQANDVKSRGALTRTRDGRPPLLRTVSDPTLVRFG